MTDSLRAPSPSRPPAGPSDALLVAGYVIRFAISITWVGILAAALLASLSTAVRAQIKVEGPSDAVSIDVVNAPLRDVLAALQTRFGLRYRSNDALDTERTVKLHAPLHRVIARLLEGYDFVVMVAPDGIDVLILQPSAIANVVIPRIVRARAPAPAAPVMASGQANRRERD